MGGVVLRPVAVEQPVLLRQAMIEPSAWIGCQDAEEQSVELGLVYKLHRTLEHARGIGVEAEHERPLNADAGAVKAVDEVHEILRGAVAAGGGEVAGGLIAP